MLQSANFLRASATWLGHARAHGRNAVWVAVEQGANPLITLALTPYLLPKLGRHEFGVWAFALTLVGMSPLVSFGAGIATTKHVSADLGAGNRRDAVAVIRAALAVAILGGLFAIGLCWGLGSALAASTFARMGPAESIGPVITLCALAAAVQEIDNVFAGAMRGAQRFDVAARTEVPMRLAMACALVYFASGTPDVSTLLTVLIAAMALKAALKGWTLLALFRDRSCCYPSFAAAPLRRVLQFGIWQWLQTAGTVFFATADQLLVGGLLGAAALARYSVCLQIAQYVHMVPSVMMQVLLPRLSSLGHIDARRGNRILRSATLAALVTAAILGLPLILLARPLLTLWVGAEFAADNQWLLITLVAVHVTLAFNIGSFFVLLGSGRAARSAIIVLLAGAVQFGTAMATAPLGLLAVACSRFSYSFLTAFLYKAARYPTHDG